jgi:hypothetical protein
MIAVLTVGVTTIGFIVGWWLAFDYLVDRHRPDGCDGPCLSWLTSFTTTLSGAVSSVRSLLAYPSSFSLGDVLATRLGVL